MCTVVYFEVLRTRRCHLGRRQEKSWIKWKRDWNILSLYRGKQNRDSQSFNKKGKRNNGKTGELGLYWGCGTVIHFFSAPLLDALFCAGNLPIGGEKISSEGIHECSLRLCKVRS